ncbi:MAG: hypothetical protein RLW68_01705 [Devosia marina]|uniref:hypothetical protein n=1 Tax=Devosia marina TaxID=2683198 RepID=UPI0032ED00BD
MASNVINIHDGKPIEDGRLHRTLKDGGGGGTYDGMEARVKRLEDDGKELRQDLKTIMRDLAEIKGRVNAMPTTWQMVGFVVALCLAFFTYMRFGLGLGG